MLTQTSFTQTNIVDALLGLPSQAYESISGLVTGQIVIDTNYTIGVDYGQIKVKAGLFPQIGDLTQNVSTGTNTPYYFFQYDATTTLATQYEMSFVGTNNGRCRVFITINDNAGVVQVVLNYYFQALEDQISYLTNTTLNKRSLLYNSKNNNIVLDNTFPSVYNTSKELSFAFWYNITNSFTTEFIKLQKNTQLGFYNPTTGNVSNGVFEISRGGNVFNYFTSATNNIKFSFNSIITPSFIVVQIINLSNSNTSTVSYSNNYSQTLRGSQIFLGVVTFNQVTGFENLDTQTNPLSNGVFVAGSPNEFTFDLNGSLLNANSSYRIIVNVYGDNAGVYDGFSFISEPINIISNSPEHDGKPLLTFRFFSKTNLLGANTIISSHDKLGLFFTLNGDGPSLYNAVTDRLFTWNLAKIKVQMYYVDSNYKHIVFSQTWNNSNIPNNAPTFLGAESGLTVPFDVLDLDKLYYADNGGDFINFFYQFRIRYEANIPNVQTINTLTGNALTNPTGNQDWQGKVIFVDIIATTIYNENYQIIAPFEVRNDSLVSLDVQSTFNCTEVTPNVFTCDSLNVFCNTLDQIQVVAQSTFNYSEPVLWSLDKKTYNHSQARYSELGYNGYTPPAPLLIEDFDSAFEPQTGNSVLNIIRMDTSNFQVGEQYRFACVMRNLSGVANTTYTVSTGTFTYYPNGLNFVYDQDPTQHESGSFTGVVELPIMIDCTNSDFVDDPCELWNSSHCNADSDYYIPLCVADPNPPINTFELCEPCSILPAVFNTLELTDLIATIEANIIFSNITGLVKVELYLRSEFGSWILIETFLSPTLIINYIIDVGDLELLGGLYYFKVVFYSIDCQSQSQQFHLEVHGV